MNQIIVKEIDSSVIHTEPRPVYEGRILFTRDTAWMIPSDEGLKAGCHVTHFPLHYGPFPLEEEDDE